MTREEDDRRNVERMQASQRRDRLLHEALDMQERSTIWSALSLAAGQYDESAGEFHRLAAALRRGESFPMFADGEPGALGAERLAAQFEMQAKDARALIDKFE